VRNAYLLLVGVVTAASALVTAYHVEPRTAAMSGKASGDPQYGGVSQVLTINFDELDSTAGAYCELFAGTKGAGGQYHVAVLSYPGGFPIGSGDADGNVDHEWVRFKIDIDVPDSIVKGKKLEFRFTRSGSDSIQYYYDEACGYNYGQMIAPYPPSITPSYGLAMRCYGRLNPVSDVWRACTNHGQDPAGAERDTALAKAAFMGVKWIRDYFKGWDGWDWQRDTAMEIYNRYLSGGFNIMGILCYGRDVESISSRGPDDTFRFSSYVPRNLWAKEGQTNYWAEYCHSIMDSLDSVKHWEVWPEANTPWGPHDPDTAYYKGSTPGPKGDNWIDTWRERCSLYVRMCFIAESTARDLGGEPRRRILGGATYRLLEGDGENMMSGVDWLWNVFDLAEHSYGGVENCFDIAAVHPYMHYPGYRLDFWEDKFHTNLDTARWVMRQSGYPGMELWATEYGWPRWDKRTSPPLPVTDSLMQARDICQFYTSAIARQADPRGGYDRAIHYELTRYRVSVDNDGYGFLDSILSQPLMPHGWAFTQLDTMLTGKRCNGRVMAGDTAVDHHTRVYEFEDTTTLKKRTWVCWQDEAVAAYTPVPVRSDTVDTVALAYNGSPPAGQQETENSGWLHTALDPRPTFVMEKSAASRPDLVVDSVKYVIGAPDTVLAWVTNRGNRTTPRQSPGNQPYPTWAVLYANGDSLSQRVWTDSIAVNQQVTFRFNLETAQPTPVLLAVKVNPAQTYVELGSDDNSGYRLKAQP
jgi:hypothetical protein